jgi:thiamine biosynthesis lipoprotein
VPRKSANSALFRGLWFDAPMLNRREFLHPQQLVRTAGQVAGALHEPAVSPPPPPQEIALLRFARQAMATRFEIVLPFGNPSAMQSAEDALDLIDRLEDQLTVYRDHSEVSRINRRAADRPMTVENRLCRLLAESARLTRDTAGAFDISTGALIKAWGFYRRAGRVPSLEERAEVMQRVGMQHVALDDHRRTIHFLRRGVEINLGSIGKGYALDRAADLLRQEWGITAGLLHGGCSSVYAMGSDPTNPRGWAVGVTHPWDAERRLAVLRLRDRALGTSAATFQHLEYNGRRLGHILDPRHGWPAEGMASATVTAPTAAEADALATAFFILGVEKAERYCAGHPGIGAVLLPDHPRAEPVVIGTAREEVDSVPPKG